MYLFGSINKEKLFPEDGESCFIVLKNTVILADLIMLFNTAYSLYDIFIKLDNQYSFVDDDLKYIVLNNVYNIAYNNYYIFANSNNEIRLIAKIKKKPQDDNGEYELDNENMFYRIETSEIEN